MLPVRWPLVPRMQALDVTLCYRGGTKAEVGLAQGKRAAREQDLDLYSEGAGECRTLVS